MRLKKVNVDKAVGMALAHDLTRIVPGRVKETAFRRGQIIHGVDLEMLRDMGRESLYVMQLGPQELHENDAALRLADLIQGQGLIAGRPGEGKVNLTAAGEGLLKVQASPLARRNSSPPLTVSTLHTNTVVKAGQLVASAKIVPLAVHRRYLERADRLRSRYGPLITIKPFLELKVGAVITGSEIVSGRIENGFEEQVAPRVTRHGARIIGQKVVGDDPRAIAQAIEEQVRKGARLVLVTGGLSVDPDDRTRQGIRLSGAKQVFYGSPVLPGAMFLYALRDGIPILGLPACVFYNHRTVFDLLLPRVLAGETLTRAEISALGHGGLCQLCETCAFPHCPFGKGGA